MTDQTRLILPKLGGFYETIAQPLAWVLLRVFVGGALALEGFGKIADPLAMTGFVESLGFHPGEFWSPLLAFLQFGGGIAIALGLLTRPFALANAVMLAITYWFHATHPYGDAVLTQAGIDALSGEAAHLFTQDVARRLADGGAGFLHQVQHKAETLSLMWTFAAGLYAAYGGGAWSIDRLLLKREF